MPTKQAVSWPRLLQTVCCLVLLTPHTLLATISPQGLISTNLGFPGPNSQCQGVKLGPTVKIFEFGRIRLHSAPVSTRSPAAQAEPETGPQAQRSWCRPRAPLMYRLRMQMDGTARTSPSELPQPPRPTS